MPSINWDKSLSVNNEELDAQHRELIRLYNELHEALTEGTPKEAADKKATTLEGLLKYVQYHFEFEENYMAEIGYPDLGRHKKMHLDLSKQVENFANELQTGQIVLSNTIIKFLRNWILEHLIEADNRYSQFKKSQSPE